ncbi:MAG TPA: thiamine pyrophosphate-dependent enzyme [Opitutales bacterium]|nr:thiamine pyrophosphate-dependent enzyme [Opitutales bacterium]
MHLSRITDNRILELFRQGKIRGTVAGGQGNEGLVVPIALLADKEIDTISFSHRGLGGKLIWSMELGDHISHYLANSGSPTLAREGNVHYGDAQARSYPMISHLGVMPSNVLGGTDSQRRLGRPAVGFTFFGDGASSTGDIHECMNIASLFRIPVIFVIENNEFAYSTPTSEQYATADLVSRAAGYGMEGYTIDISDTEKTIATFSEIIEKVRKESFPVLVEAKCLRLRGHAAYDTCDYVPSELAASWEKRDALPLLRQKLIENGLEDEIVRRETELSEFLEASVQAAFAHEPAKVNGMFEAAFSPTRFKADWKTDGPKEKLTAAQALQRAHRKILRERPEALLFGQDIAEYGGPFKVTEDLYAEFGRERVINTPVAESATVGYCIGLALNGHRPILEFQFADFATDATTQIVLNAATYFFRANAKVPIVFRLPCGGGLTFGSFHSQELETLFLHMPGLKALYPSTPQDAYNALLAAWEDDNPVLLFEHKGLYRRLKQEVSFDPDYQSVWQPRQILSGEMATIVSYGEMLLEAADAAEYLKQEYDYTFDLFDLRALSPMNLDPIRESLAKTHRLIVVHEGRRTAGFGAEIVSRLTEELFFEMEAPPLRIASADIPVPFAPELEAEYRPSRNSIVEAILNWTEVSV